MKTIRITKEHVQDGKYVGEYDLSNVYGNIEIESNLGIIEIPSSVVLTGNLSVDIDTHIKSGGFIRAVGFIESGVSIRANGAIEAGAFIKSGGGINANGSIKSGGSIISVGLIESGVSIKSGGSIESGTSIKSGGSIDAVESIEAELGIQAQLSISCNKSLKSGLRIFAGLCSWREPSKEETLITCGKLEGGEIAYGELVETGLPEQPNCNGKIVEIEGVKYELKFLDK